MKAFKLFASTLLAALVLSIMASAASAAFPEFLGTLPNKFKSAFGKSEMETISQVKFQCLKTSLTGEVTGAKVGTFNLEMKECLLPGTGDCHSKGNATGVVSLPGKLDLAYIEKSTKKTGLVFLLNETEVICKLVGTFTLLTKGGFIGLITPINSKTKKVTVKVVKKMLGLQEFTKYENEKGEVVNIQIEASNSGLPFEREGIELGEPMLEAEKELEIMA